MADFIEFIHQKKLCSDHSKSNNKSKLENKLPGGIQGIIALLPTFIEQSLTLDNSKRATSQTWNETIKLKLLNRNSHCMATINKNEEIARLFLLHGCRNESVVILYKLTW